ncbi:MAG: CvpA family protein [Chloroflexota bacterium]|nr:CvpA family protein [Chloroflexota bacterium]MDE3267520.1 CvpA family protein [Chloroflexota bacterium]
MNWLDIAILFLLGISVLLGWRTGLFNAAFLAGGAAAGVFVAGHLSDDVSELFTDSLFSDTLATVISYAVITTIVFLAVQALRETIKAPFHKIMKAVSVKWVDNLGGAALGLVLGLALTGGSVAMMARLASDLPKEIEAMDLEGIDRTELQTGLNDSLTESALVPVYLEARRSVPGDAMGFVPDDFDVALDILEAQIDGGNREGS